MKMTSFQTNPEQLIIITAPKPDLVHDRLKVFNQSFRAELTNNDQVGLAKARCLKITEKVSFNIASEASYVYILSGQKLIKNAKNDPFFGEFLKT